MADEPDFSVVGRSTEIEGPLGATSAPDSASVDVAVIDATASDGEAIRAVEALSHQPGGPRCVLVSMAEDSTYAGRALEAGSFGYVGRSEFPWRVPDAVRAASKGEVYVSHGTAMKVLADVLSQEPPPASSGPAGLGKLTDREMDVFRLLSGGQTPAAIAVDLGIQHRTVRLHIRHVQRKLRAGSYADLLKLSAEWREDPSWAAGEPPLAWPAAG